MSSILAWKLRMDSLRKWDVPGVAETTTGEQRHRGEPSFEKALLGALEKYPGAAERHRAEARRQRLPQRQAGRRGGVSQDPHGGAPRRSSTSL